MERGRRTLEERPTDKVVRAEVQAEHRQDLLCSSDTFPLGQMPQLEMGSEEQSLSYGEAGEVMAVLLTDEADEMVGLLASRLAVKRQ